MSDKLYKTLKKLIGLDSTSNSTISSRKSSSRTNSTISSRKSSSRTNSTISSRKSSSRTNSTNSTKSSMYYTPEPSPTTQRNLVKQFKSLPVELRRQIMCEVLSTENIVFIFDLFRNVNDIKRCPNFKHIRWSDIRNITSIKFIIAFEEFIDYQSIKEFTPNMSIEDYEKYIHISRRLRDKEFE
jgi:hypothetical protein